MARKHASKVSYVRADSGYISDLISSARKSDEAAAALLTSSPSCNSSSIEFTLSTFDDTAWDDVGRSSRQVAQQNRLCRQIAARIKTPTRFPIKPLAETMDRAREEAKKADRKEAAKKSGSSFVRSLYAQPVASQPVVRKMDDGSTQRGLWVDGKWVVPVIPAMPVRMGDESAQGPMAEERNFRPKRIVLINRRDRDHTGIDDIAESVVGRADFQPKRITLINRDMAAERDFRPKRIVLINRHPAQDNAIADNTIKSGDIESVIASENDKVTSKPTVDGLGRTRAATKEIREQVAEADIQKRKSHKRKSEGSAEGERQVKNSKLDTSD